MSRLVPKNVPGDVRDPARQWHPLDGVPAPDYVPEVWTPEHVGHRLVGGFEILNRMPMSVWPRGVKTCWPEVYVDAIDRNQDVGLDSSEQQRRRDLRNETRPKPSSLEIAAMEQAVSWPIDFLADEADVARAVLAWANARARGHDTRRCADRLRVSYATFKRRRNTGLLVITVGLIGAEIPVS